MANAVPVGGLRQRMICTISRRYSKQAEGWLLSDFSSLEVSIFLDSVAIALSMAEIYRGVVFK
ncbi:MAG: hypothetical protein RMZ41_025070 [Nostoc sp. DedVER02]|uniref:hypothetical protein n=1 Tax=unclassified Nostoc TaxID=2593658 RepID=UPI002AD2ED69|nr:MULTISPECIES: hypothetical protein [unclassified Nostoc]MDZ7986537.1 hypothetical protein [Nostoc sp. DedVER02]MDZ8113924.1 hypothetical protein [Nostoc sp. DedVER01b]